MSSFDLTAYTYAIFGYSYTPPGYTSDEQAALIHAPISATIGAAAADQPEPKERQATKEPFL